MGMIIDSLQTGGDLETKLRVPTDKTHGGELPSLFASALEDYKDGQWYAFGTQLGAAMQELVVTTFPAKYEVDDFGSLKRVLGASEVGQASTMAHTAGFLTSFFCIALGTIMLLFVILAVARNKQMWRLFMSKGAKQGFCHLPLDSSDGMIVE